MTLGPADSLYLKPNEGREIINKTNKPPTMLVAVNHQDPQVVRQVVSSFRSQ